MAASSRSPRIAFLATLSAVLLIVNASVHDAWAAERRRELPVSLDAASSDVDYRTNTVVFRDIVISQGDIRVSAARARATGLDFENSNWTFEGDVRIQVPDGKLGSTQAVVSFLKNRITRALITGAPAEFEQARKGTNDLARGRAGTIDYDIASGSVKLSQDAWLSDGRNEITGQLLVYRIAEQRVQAQAAPGQQDRVRITIRPRGESSASDPSESAGGETKPPANPARP